MNKNKVIRTIAMTNYLLGKKCELYQVDRDRNDKSKLIFLFVDNEYLRQCMDEYEKIEY